MGRGFQSPGTPRVIKRYTGSEWTCLLSPLASLSCGEVRGGMRNRVGPCKAHAQGHELLVARTKAILKTNTLQTISQHSVVKILFSPYFFPHLINEDTLPNGPQLQAQLSTLGNSYVFSLSLSLSLSLICM